MESKAEPAGRHGHTAIDRVRSLLLDGVERLRDFAVSLAVTHRHGPKVIEASDRQAIVLTVVRDGEVYLPAFLKHYAALGVCHFVFLDNGSTDRTAAIVAETGTRSTLLSCRLPFGVFKRSMRRYLVSRFGRRSWILLVDIDEFFDFPRSDVMRLEDLLDYLNRDGVSAMTTQMLDLCPVSAAGDVSHGLADHRFYDISSLKRRPFAQDDERRQTGCTRTNPTIAIHSGGSWQTLLGIKPLRTKHSLLFPSRGVKVLDAHYVAHARVGDLSAVLYHYKFAEGFSERVRVAAAGRHDAVSGRYWSDVARRLEGRVHMALPADRSRELTSVRQLVDEGFLVTSARYEALARDFAARGDAGRSPALLGHASL